MRAPDCIPFRNGSQQRHHIEVPRRKSAVGLTGRMRLGFREGDAHFRRVSFSFSFPPVVSELCRPPTPRTYAMCGRVVCGEILPSRRRRAAREATHACSFFDHQFLEYSLSHPPPGQSDCALSESCISIRNAISSDALPNSMNRPDVICSARPESSAVAEGRASRRSTARPACSPRRDPFDAGRAERR
jgi:hypothetical protein